MASLESSLEVRRYGGETAVHSHPHHQVVLPLRGILEMEIGSRQGRVTALVAAAIPAGQTHGFAGSGENAFLILDMEDKGIRDPLRARFWGAVESNPFVPVDPALASVCAFLAGEIRRYGLAGSQASLAGDLLIGALSRRLDLAADPLADSLERAVTHMNSRFTEPVSIVEISWQAGLGVSRFHEVFRERFGITPGRYIARLRLTHAARLLEESALPISAIALEVGYSDQSTFTRAFRRHFAMPPRRWRSLLEDRHKIQ